MIPNLTGHRRESYRFTKLALSGGALGPLANCTGGKIDWSRNRVIRSGGSVSIDSDENLRDLLLRVEYVLDEGTPREWSDSLGVFVCSSPERSYEDGIRSQDITLYDKLILLDQDQIANTLQLPVGTAVIAAVRNQIELAGGSNISLTPSSKTLTQAMTWAAGTTRLRIINDLLEAINYFALWCDGTGQYRAEPNIDPAKRPIAYVFREGRFAIHEAAFTLGLNDVDVPNKFIAIQRSDGTTEPLTYWEALPDSSSFSYAARGRWITQTSTNVEAVGIDELKAVVKRAISEATEIRRTLKIKHAYLPLRLNDVVEFDTDGVTGYFVVTAMDAPVGDAGSLTTTSLTEVIR